MLTLRDATISQGDFTLRADFTIDAAKRYAVIGPSGCGKSTLLAAMCGFLPLASGNVYFEGADITDSAPASRPIAMLFQDNNLFPHLSVSQNVGLGIRPDLRLTREDQARIVGALNRVGLAGLGPKRPGNLSGGQQSRAALARVLLQDRPLLLLDEPFAALGPALRDEMLDLVQELVSDTGAAMVMVTHNPDDVLRIAQETIFVAQGRANAPAPAEELIKNPPPALRDYLGSS